VVTHLDSRGIHVNDAGSADRGIANVLKNPQSSHIINSSE
jgi:hypothetical protein